MFDLDGTVTRHDTLAPFVFGYLLRHPWRLPLALGALPACIGYLFGRTDPGGVKSAFIRATLGGLRRADLEDWTEQFLLRLIARRLHREALARIGRHKERGDYLVLLSASTDLYVPRLGDALGFAEVICTGLVWEGGRLDGRLATANRRGEEKVRCLERLRAAHPGRLFAAYGNAASDIPHLRMVERPLLVNGNREARELAARAGIPQARWH